MSDPSERWERLLPLSGAAFALLMVAAAAAFPMPPGGDVSAASKPGWLSGHVNVVIAQSYVRALAALAFIALAVAVATVCRRALRLPSPLPATALAGGVLTGALLLISQSVGVAAALQARDGASGGTVRALGALQDGLLNLSSLPAVLLFGAAGVVALHTGLLPRWLTIVTLLGVPFALIDAASYDGGPFEAVGFIGLVYFLAWSLLVGGHLYVNARSASAGRSSHRAAVTVTT